MRKSIFLLFVLSTALFAVTAADNADDKAPTSADNAHDKAPPSKIDGRKEGSRTDYHGDVEDLLPTIGDDIWDQVNIRADKFIHTAARDEKEPSEYGRKKSSPRRRRRRRRRRRAQAKKRRKNANKRIKGRRKANKKHLNPTNYTPNKPTSTQPTTTSQYTKATTTSPTTTVPATTSTQSTTTSQYTNAMTTSPTTTTTTPTTTTAGGYVGGQSDEYPVECKCRELQDNEGDCYDLDSNLISGRCTKRTCGKSYECVPGGGTGLQDCMRRVARDEVRVVASYKGLYDCERVPLRRPKFFYTLYY